LNWKNEAYLPVTKKELLFRLIRRISIGKKIHKSILLKNLSSNKLIKNFNRRYLNFTLKEKEIFHGLYSKLFYNSQIYNNIYVDWELNFCGKQIKIPIETNYLKIDWHTALSVIGTDVDVKAFYKNIILSDFRPGNLL